MGSTQKLPRQRPRVEEDWPFPHDFTFFPFFGIPSSLFPPSICVDSSFATGTLSVGGSGIEPWFQEDLQGFGVSGLPEGCPLVKGQPTTPRKDLKGVGDSPVPTPPGDGPPR